MQFPFHDESGSVSGRTFMKGDANMSETPLSPRTLAIHRTSASEHVLSLAVVPGHGSMQFPFHDERGSV